MLRENRKIVKRASTPLAPDLERRIALAIRKARSTLWAMHLKHELQTLLRSHPKRSPERDEIDSRYRRLRRRLADYASGRAIVRASGVQLFGGFAATNETHASELWIALEPVIPVIQRDLSIARLERRVIISALVGSLDIGYLVASDAEQHLDRLAALVLAIRREKNRDAGAAFVLGRLLVREAVYFALRPEYVSVATVLWDIFRMEILKDLTSDDHAFSKTESCFGAFVEALQSMLEKVKLQTWRSAALGPGEPLAHSTAMDLTSKFVRLFVTPGAEAIDDLIGGFRVSNCAGAGGTPSVAYELEKYPLFVRAPRRRSR